MTTTWLPDPFPNAAPKALDRHVTVEIDTPSRTPSVLLGVYDVENDPVSVAAFKQPAHGAASLNPDGTFTYKPQPGYVGEDEFAFTLGDGRGGTSTARMRITVIRPSGQWATTSFTNLAEIQAGGTAIDFGKSTTVPRAVDWNGDGKMDLLVSVSGTVWRYLSTGTSVAPQFSAGVRIQAGGQDIDFGLDRLAIAFVDVNGDGPKDLVVIPARDRKPRVYRNLASGKAEPQFAKPALLKTRAGEDFVADDIRADVADWNGDGRPDLITGSRAGAVRIAYNVGTAAAPLFDSPTTALDANGRTIDGAYNLNVRIADINQDGILDFVDSYNWGNINFRINTGTRAKPALPHTGRFDVTGLNHAAVNLHSLCDGAIVDFADFNGDGTIDLVVGGEVGGKIHLAFGQSARFYLAGIEEMIAAHPLDLGASLTNALAASRMKSLLGSLNDYAEILATPSQKATLSRELARLISSHPQYLKLQKFDLKKQPGIPSLAVQVWLTLLTVDYHSPANRRLLAEVAGFTGGYRKLAEEIGLIYAENNENPLGAEAIYEWMRTIPRELYPGTCITANDWLGGRTFLVRGHTKNTFNGSPLKGGEYGFGSDARAVIGARGSENWFMTVVRHEACHDLDACVRQSPEWTRRWGQVLVRAGGPDMRADPLTGWFSRDLTRQHFREAGYWDGDAKTWNEAWKGYWEKPPGKGWRDFGFMRGNIPWFYDAPQESLATQGNQFWNSTEGRLEVAIARWNRGYRSALTEVLFFTDLWSLGLDKMKFYEIDDACNQVIAFARLRRTPQGYLDRIDLGDRYYEFKVDAQGVATEILHAPERMPGK